MIAPTAGWFALLLSLGLALDTSSDKGELVTLNGRVVLLSAALKASGHSFDADPVAKQVVVKGADGTLTPILSDDASRALFLDERLRDRPTEIKGRRYPGNPYVQVLTFRIEDNGRLRTPEYYCEICTISVRYPQICPCCQGPMELRMKPEPR
jgi:hypothetical protein